VWEAPNEKTDFCIAAVATAAFAAPVSADGSAGFVTGASFTAEDGNGKCHAANLMLSVELRRRAPHAIDLTAMGDVVPHGVSVE
jgi:hypothetical protein